MTKVQLIVNMHIFKKFFVKIIKYKTLDKKMFKMHNVPCECGLRWKLAFYGNLLKFSF